MERRLDGESSQPLPQLIPAVVVQVGSLVLAVCSREIQRIVLLKTISPLPGTVEALRGVTVIEGEAAFVVDFHELLQQPHRLSWPSSLGIWGKIEGESLVLAGGQVRWVGRMRRALEFSECVAPKAHLFEGSVEWKRSPLPLLSWEAVQEAMTTGSASSS